MALKRGITPQSDPASNPESPFDFGTAVKQLSDQDPALRRASVHALAKHPEAVGALVDRLKKEEMGLVRQSILTALVGIGDAAAVSGFAECLHSEDANLRNGAIEALKLLPDRTAPFIPALLADPNSDVRILTISILESLKYAEVESWLISIVEKDTHVNVCGAALDLLAEVGSQHALEPIQRLKQRFEHEPYVQFAADLALKRIRGN